MYNTDTDIAQFRENAELWKESQRLSGDSLYYEQVNGFGEAFGNVQILDTIDHSLITGQYGQYMKNPERGKVIGEPVYSNFNDGDSLHIHGDSIQFDSDSIRGDLLRIYHDVKMFRSDLQGKCDSLTYSSLDSTFRMFRNPVMWSDDTQMSGDTILIEMRNGKMDSIKIIDDAFILSRDTLDQFNQVKGRLMKGKFKDQKLSKMYSFGNGQTAYYAREEDGTEVGLNRANCSNIMIHFRNNQVYRVSFLVKPDAILYPPDKIPAEERVLPGFNPRFRERPKEKADIFYTDKRE
jgi:hypothetical protein